MHRDAQAPRLINLPSGEAFIAPYEGERDDPSLTSGVLPLPYENEIVRLGVNGQFPVYPALPHGAPPSALLEIRNAVLEILSEFDTMI